MPQIKLLKVMPNPYHVEVDHEGRLHGGLLYEPDVRRGDASLRHVGCRLVAKQLREAIPAEQLTDDWDHTWLYSKDPVVVPDTAYYLTAIRNHTLLPADADAHLAAFGTRQGFTDPLVRLAQYAKERGVCPEPKAEWGPLLNLATHVEE